jgi:hypothetical protein
MAPLEYGGSGGGVETRPAGLAGLPGAAAASPSAFDVTVENRRPGTARDRVPTQWSSTTALAGFLGQNASTPRRRTVDLHVSSTLGNIRIHAYRVGYYHGAGQRLVWTSGPVRVHRQRSCTVQRGTRMVSCPWAVTIRVNTSGWPEGLYYLILSGGSGREHMIPLVVESASVTGKVVLVVNDCTMEAYNGWGGYSLYTGPGHRYRTRSLKVSFDRPYKNFSEIDERDTPLIRAAESIQDCASHTPPRRRSPRTRPWSMGPPP